MRTGTTAGLCRRRASKEGRSARSSRSPRPPTTSTPAAASVRRSERSARMTLSLTFLAPDIVAAVIAGNLSRRLGLTAVAELPMSWSEQRKRLGHASSLGLLRVERSTGPNQPQCGPVSCLVRTGLPVDAALDRRKRTFVAAELGSLAAQKRRWRPAETVKSWPISPLSSENHRGIQTSKKIAEKWYFRVVERVVEPRRIELLTSSLRTTRSPS